jgi:hypothetical protein
LSDQRLADNPFLLKELPIATNRDKSRQTATQRRRWRHQRHDRSVARKS